MSVNAATLPTGSIRRPVSPAGIAPLPRRIVWGFGGLATLLAALGSWIPSLWGDEGASVLSAKRSIPSLLHMIQHVDAVHATYYFGLHWWVKVFGASPFSVRFPSAIAVGLGAVALILLAERLSGPRLAVFAGIIYVLLPRVTYMGEEARSYAFDAAIAAWLLLLLVDLVRDTKTKRIWWVVYGALLALSIYLFLYLALFVVVHALVVLASRPSRRLGKSWLIATAAAVLVASPVAIASASERAQIAFLSGEVTTDFSSLAVGLWFTGTGVAVIAWVLILLAAATWILRLRRRGFSTAGGPSVELVAFAWLIVPGGLLLLSNLVVADFSGRYLSMSAPGAALAMAIGVERLATWRLLYGVVATVVVLALCVPVYLSQRTPYAKNQSDWAEISAVIGKHSSAGQAVVFDEGASPSKKTRLAYRTYPQGFRNVTDVALDVPYWENYTWYDRALTVPEVLSSGRLSHFSTVWVIEYSASGKTDTYGLADLKKAGYAVEATYKNHRSVVYELLRGNSTRD